jgi:hypothetical protein
MTPTEKQSSNTAEMRFKRQADRPRRGTAEQLHELITIKLPDAALARANQANNPLVKQIAL